MTRMFFRRTRIARIARIVIRFIRKICGRIIYRLQAIKAGGGVLHEGSDLAVFVLDEGDKPLKGLVYLGGLSYAAFSQAYVKDVSGTEVHAQGGVVAIMYPVHGADGLVSLLYVAQLAEGEDFADCHIVGILGRAKRQSRAAMQSQHTGQKWAATNPQDTDKAAKLMRTEQRQNRCKLRRSPTEKRRERWRNRGAGPQKGVPAGTCP